MPKIRQKFEDSTQCKTDRVEIDLWEFKEFAEQSITMLGQMFNIITHNRHLSALKVLRGFYARRNFRSTLDDF